MDLAGASTVPGTKLQVWNCDNRAFNQQWDLIQGLAIRMTNAFDVCLDLYGGATDNGTPINVWNCNGLVHQRWFFDTGTNMIQYAGDRSKCIDAGDMQDGTRLMLWECNGLNQQNWGYDGKTVYLPTTSNSPQATMCMDLAGGSYKLGTPMQVWHCNGCWNQLFQIIGPASGPPGR